MSKSTFIRRFIAGIIDAFFLLIIIIVFTVAVILPQMDKSYIQYYPWIIIQIFFYPLIYLLNIIYAISNNSLDILLVYSSLGVFLAEVLYYFIFELLPIKATIGHKLLGLTILDVELKQLSIKQLFLRSLLKTVTRYFFCIPMITILFTKNRQALHDIIVNSVVISQK